MPTPIVAIFFIGLGGVLSACTGKMDQVDTLVDNKGPVEQQSRNISRSAGTSTEFVLDPPVHDFGSAKARTLLTKDFVFLNKSNDPTRVTAANITSGPFTITKNSCAATDAPLLPGKTCGLTVTYAPLEEGRFAGRIRLEVTRAGTSGSTPEVVESSLFGTAEGLIDTIPPSLTLSSPSKSPVNRAARTEYTVQYKGADTIQLTDTMVRLAATGTAACAITLEDAGPTARRIVLQACTGDGRVSVSIDAGSAQDASGNKAPAAGPSESLVVDNSRPVAPTVLARALTNQRFPEFKWTTDPADAISQFRVSIDPTGPDSPSEIVIAATYKATTALSQGAHTFRVSAQDTAGNWSDESVFPFEIDLLPPDLSLLGPSPGASASGSAVLNGTCESGLPLDARGSGLAAPASLACANGVFTQRVYFSQGDGLKSVTLTQVDLAGNIAWVARDFINDTTPPPLNLTAPLNNAFVLPVFIATGTCEPNRAVFFTGGDVQSPEFTLCGAGGSFAQLLQLVPGDGLKSVPISQADAVGNTAQASARVILDTLPPTVTIGGWGEAQVGAAGAATAEITYGGADSIRLSTQNVTLLRTGDAQCAVQISPSPASPLSRRLTLSQCTGNGTIRFNIASASANDAAGNAAPAVGPSDSLSVDTQAPSAPVVSAPTLVQTRLPTWSWAPSGGGTGKFRALVDATDFSPAVGETSATTFTPPAPLGDGAHTLYVQERDQAGNWSSSGSATVVVDATPPQLSIAAPSPNTNAIMGVTLSGYCEPGLPISASGTGLAASTVITCDPTTSSFSQALNFSAGDGPKTLTLSQTDAAGNAATVSRAFIRDGVPPAFSLSAPSNGAAFQSQMLVTGTCESDLLVRLDGSALSSPQMIACVSGAFSQAIALASGDGLKTLEASQTDLAGNTSQASRSVTRDSQAPNLILDAPAANSVFASSLTLTGSCEAGLPVVVEGTGLAGTVSGTCDTGTQTFTIALSFSAGDGSKSIVASQTDAAGNRREVPRTFVRDTIPPQLSVLSPGDGASARNGVTLVGSCESGFQIGVTGSGLSSATSVACVSGAFSFPVSFSTGEGPKTMTLTQSDAAGNQAQVNRTYIRDQVPPALALGSPAANTAAALGVTLNGTCETGLELNIGGAGIQSASTLTCAGGSFSQAVVFSIPDGIKPVVLSQTDAAGNVTTVTRDFLRDSQPPALAIASPTALSSAQSAVAMTGSCEDATLIFIGGSGAASPAVTSCVGGAFNQIIQLTAGEGTKQVLLTQSDAAGNTAQASRIFVRDNTPPLLAVASPASGSSAQSGVTLSGSCEPGLPVVASGSGVSTSVQTLCAGGTFSLPIAFSDGDGTKTIGLAQSDAAGNLSSLTLSFLRDTSAPGVALGEPTATIVRAADTVDYPVTFDGAHTVVLDAAKVTLMASGSADCTPAVTGSGTLSRTVRLTNCTGNGTVAISILSASALDSAGNTSAAAGPSSSFTVDNTAPVTPSVFGVARTNDTTPTWAWSGAGGGSGTFRYRLDSPDVAAGATLSTALSFTPGTPLAQGSHTLYVQERDLAGNWSVSGQYEIDIDTQAPSLALVSPAANTAGGPVLSVTGVCEPGLTVQLGGGGHASPSTTPCSISGTFAVDVTFSAGDGPKDIVFSQTDSASNTVTVTRTFLRDTIPPALAFSAPAAMTSAQTGLTLAGACESGVDVAVSGTGISAPINFVCAAGAFNVPVSFSAGEGLKQVRLLQTDQAGNTAMATRDFLRDNTVPGLNISAPSQALVNGSASVSYTIGVAGADALSLGAAQVSLDSTSGVSCTVLVTGSGLTARNVTLTDCTGDGTAALRVAAGAASDAAGNTSVAIGPGPSFVVDNTPPAPPLVSAGTPTNNRRPTWSFLSAGSGAGLFRYRVDGGDPSAASPTTTGTSHTPNSDLSEGPHTLAVQEVDAAGNWSASGTFTVVVDTTAPLLALTSPASGSAAATGVTLSGTCEAHLPVHFAGSGLSSPSSTPCSAGGLFLQSVLFSAGEGGKSVMISQSDASGNVTSMAVPFVRDSTPPSLVLSAPLEGAMTNAGVLITGSCEDGLGVSLGGSGLATPSQVSCASGSFSANMALASGDGAKGITVSQTDAAGNTTSHARIVVLDTVAPAPAFTSPAALTSTQGSFVLRGTCEGNLVVLMGGPIVPADQTFTCASGGTFERTVSLAGTDGDKSITLSQTDAAGNTGGVARVFRRDTAAPPLVIGAPSQTRGNGVSPVEYLVEYTDADVISLDAGHVSLLTTGTANCAVSVTSHSTTARKVSLSGCTGNGTVTIQIAAGSASDAAGNAALSAGPGAVVTVDTSAPSISLLSLAGGAALTTQTTLPISVLGSDNFAEAGLSVRIKETSGSCVSVFADDSWSAYTGPAQTLSLVLSNANGFKKVCAWLKDAAGNIAPGALANIILDKNLPTAGSAVATPAQATRDTALTCGVSGFNDLDGEPLTYSYSWKRNGTIAAALTSATVPANTFAKSDVVQCSVIASDGLAETAAVTSQDVTIQNTPPVAGTAGVSPSNASRQNTLTCAPSGFSDPDGDGLIYAFAWYVGTASPTQIPGQTTAFLAPGWFNKGETVSCRVRAGDGSASSGEAASAGVLIQNSPPTVGVASVTPASPTRASPLTCAVTGFADADGDSLTYAYAWTKNGSIVSGQSQQTLPTTAFTRGDLLRCLVIASDGTVASDTATSPAVTIQNAAPVAGSLALTPASAGKSDTLTCSPSGFTDADSDPLTYAYEWYVGSASPTIIAGQTLPTLSPSQFSKGQTIRCRVTASDGLAPTPAVTSASVTILNSAPTEGILSLTPASAFKNSTLTCAPDGFADADGDAISYSYSWLRNGSLVGGQSGTTLTGTSFSKGDLIQCQVVASDGAVSSGLVNSPGVAIGNLAPAVGTVALTPALPTKLSTLTCAPSGFTDGDGDGLTYSYVWSINGAVVTGQTAQTLNNTQFSRNDTVQCLASATDGTDWSSGGLSSTVTVLNSAPAALAGTLTVTGRSAQGVLSASDDDPADLITFAVVAQPAKGTLTSFNANTGAYTYTPHFTHGQAGADAFSFQASDGTANSSTRTISVSFNHAAPTVSSFSPTQSALAGGGVMNISGTGFLPNVSVTVGGQPCLQSGGLPADTNGAGTLISCLVPAGSSGSAAVVVENFDGQRVNAGTLTYADAASLGILGTTALGGVDYGAAQDVTLTVQNTGAIAANSISFPALNAPWSQVSSTCGSSLAGGNATCTMTLRFTPANFNPSSVNYQVSYFDGSAIRSVSVALSATGKPAVKPMYPTNGAHWTQWIKNSVNATTKIWTPADVQCGGDAESDQTACVHGGERLKVELPGYPSCGGLTLTESIGAFNWTCKVVSGTAVFQTEGLKTNKSLRDLVNANSWKDNSVTISDAGAPVLTSTAKAWWSTPVESLAAASLSTTTNTSLTLGSSPAKVWTLDANATAYGISFDANNIAFVTLPGVMLTSVTAFGTNFITMNNKNYTWLEVDTTVGANDTGRRGVYISSSNWVTVRGTKMLGRAGTDYHQTVGFRVENSSSFNFFHNIQMARMRGWYLRGVYKSTFSNLTLSVVNDTALNFDGAAGTSTNYSNILQNVIINNAANGGIYFRSAYSSYNRVSHTMINSTSQIGYFTDGIYNTYLGVTATKASNVGMRLRNTNNNVVNALLVNNAGAGLTLDRERSGNAAGCVNGGGSLSANSTVLHNVMSVRNPINVHDCGVTGSLASGMLAYGPASETNCAVWASTTTNTTDATCAAGQFAGFARRITDLDLSGAFVGALLTDDATNTTDTNGSRAFNASNLTQQLIAFDPAYPLRFWGRDAANAGERTIAQTSNRGVCSGSNVCRIWDYALKATDASVRNTSAATCPMGASSCASSTLVPNGSFAGGMACPVGSNGSDVTTVQLNSTTTKDILSNAYEILFDNVGNDDGLCDSYENCVYTPNIGYYQGEGGYSANASCTFTSGTLSGIGLYGFETNGR